MKPFWSILLLSIAAIAAADAPRILAVGDSITHGYWSGIGANPYNSYRKALKALLVDEGFEVDFVGGLTDGDFADAQHEGHDGWYADHPTATNRVKDHVAGWVTTHAADIVLLHIGTNDIIHDHADATEVSDILDEIYAANSNATVILALIINALPASGKMNDISTYNTNLLAMAYSRSGDDLVVVDMEAALDNAGPDMNDTWHPTQLGYDKMATNWYPAVKAALIRRAGPPRIETVHTTAGWIDLGLSNLAPNRTLVLETATQLTSNAWTTADSFVATGATTNWQTPTSASNAFFRPVILYP